MLQLQRAAGFCKRSSVLFTSSFWQHRTNEGCRYAQLLSAESLTLSRSAHRQAQKDRLHKNRSTAAYAPVKPRGPKGRPKVRAAKPAEAASQKAATSLLKERQQSSASASTSQPPTHHASRPHTPVLLEEVLTAFQDQHLTTFLDGTLGAGGHSAAVAGQHPELRTLVGIDMDPAAHAIAHERLKGLTSASGEPVSVRQIQGNFRALKEIIQRELGGAGKVDGILLDLGMSSMQVDTPERGFSFLGDGPLDMRMGPQAARTAEEIVNCWSESALQNVLKDYGELMAFRTLAADIVAAREVEPIRTTRQLLAAIGVAIDKPLRNKGSKKALMFQALRIAVNDELDMLERTLPDAIDALAPGGRLAVITFHSLEDRMVKWAFLRAAGRPTPAEEVHISRSELAMRTSALARAQAVGKILTRAPIRPGREEVAANPRARSAKLRILEKL